MQMSLNNLALSTLDLDGREFYSHMVEVVRTNNLTNSFLESLKKFETPDMNVTTIIRTVQGLTKDQHIAMKDIAENIISDFNNGVVTPLIRTNGFVMLSGAVISAFSEHNPFEDKVDYAAYITKITNNPSDITLKRINRLRTHIRKFITNSKLKKLLIETDLQMLDNDVLTELIMLDVLQHLQIIKKVK